MQRLTSRDNSVIKEAAKLKGKASYRKKHRQFVIEGLRLTMDAVFSGVSIEALLCSDTAAEKYGDNIAKIRASAKKSYILSDALFDSIADTSTPQGIMCICGFCDNISDYSGAILVSTALALENIQDPSNMGNILRTAEALGVTDVFLSKDCVDVYSPKVLRGSMGAVFRLNMTIVESLETFARELKSKGIKAAMTVPDRNAVPITSVPDFKDTVVFIGNEGNGISKSTLDCADIKITVPMPGRAESLNASAAAAIVLWEMQRKNVI